MVGRERGGAEGAFVLDEARPPESYDARSFRLTTTRIGASRGARYGVINETFWDTKVEKGATYDVDFYARTDNGHVGLVFSLESADGRRVLARTTFPEVGGEWGRYAVALVSRGRESKARLVISPIEPTTIWLDSISASRRKHLEERREAK